MNISDFSSERRFRLCDYSISHSQLLIRSPKSDNYENNIDLIFQGVFYLSIIDTLYGIKVCKSDDEVDVELYNDSRNLFSIDSSTSRFYIGASSVLICSNVLELQETSLGVLKYKGRDAILGRIA